MRALSFDIFCRVIDNFGDAGVCWRLAGQLAALGHPVRLWIDRPDVLARLLPALRARDNGAAGGQADPTTQTIAGVQIAPWQAAEQARPPKGGVVIEAFACALPPAYEAALAAQGCLWINLEYLSAESWVDGCHGLPSPQSNGVAKYFYSPGFTPATGGLLREPDLLARRARAQARDRRHRLQVLTGLPTHELPGNARCILLFCYPDAPLAGLQAGLSELDTPSWLLVPGPCPPALRSQGAVQVHTIPFVPQARFDELLWCCDLNFVRGEDSLVRGLWAGSPLVWQIYRQPDAVHLDKLDAWLAHAQWPASATALTRAWNQQDDAALAHSLRRALQPDDWNAWQARSQGWSAQLASRPGLARELLGFCRERLQHL